MSYSKADRRPAPRARSWSAGGTLAALAVAALAALPARAQDTAGTDIARRAIHVCASCHGDGGRSTQGSYPNLAGQSTVYLTRQLKDFRAQQRAEADSKAYMWGVSALLDDETIQSLAEYYAAQSPATGHAAGGARQLALGRRIFTEGIADRNVRACASCHGDKAEGQAAFPRLAGQPSSYLYAQLVGFGTKLRPHGVLMKEEAAGMTNAEKRAVALYLQSL